MIFREDRGIKSQVVEMTQERKDWQKYFKSQCDYYCKLSQKLHYLAKVNNTVEAKANYFDARSVFNYLVKILDSKFGHTYKTGTKV